MSGERVERRLAAILAVDVASYSRLMGADEEGTLERLKALRHELVDPQIAEHHGRIVKTTGDVARPASRSACATKSLRGLNQPLPLPCANNTIPLACTGRPSNPSSPTGGIQMVRTGPSGFLSTMILLPFSTVSTIRGLPRCAR
jgi:hypothetical protein